jgi:hypothetical protein
MEGRKEGAHNYLTMHMEKETADAKVPTRTPPTDRTETPIQKFSKQFPELK